MLGLEDAADELLRLHADFSRARLERAEGVHGVEAGLCGLRSLLQDLLSVFFAAEDWHLVVGGHVGDGLESADPLVALELVELGELEESVRLGDDARSSEDGEGSHVCKC